MPKTVEFSLDEFPKYAMLVLRNLNRGSTPMFEVKRFGKVLGKVLGRRTPEGTKAEAVKKFGEGVSIGNRVL